jgi:hypothetical protein
MFETGHEGNPDMDFWLRRFFAEGNRWIDIKNKDITKADAVKYLTEILEEVENQTGHI